MHPTSVIRPAVARLRRESLDRRIAGGAVPREGRDVALRAEQLVSSRRRRRLAAGIRRLAAAAEKPHAPFSSSAPLQRRELLASQALLTELASHLEDDDRVSPRGVALIERLLTDGTSPVYLPHPDGALDAALRQARAALLAR